METAPYPERECESVRAYNGKHWGKAWRIVGMTWQGSAYCDDCAGEWPTYEHDLIEGPEPVFASDDTDGLSCDECHRAIGSWVGGGL